MSKNEEAKQCKITDLRPNNLYLSSVKLEGIELAYTEGKESELPPVLVADIDGDLVIIDGHSRAYIALKNDINVINAIIKPISEIEGEEKLYRAIHDMAIENDVQTVEDLSDCILNEENYSKIWIGLCLELLDAIED